ncbi:hypothetical protein SEA_LENNOX_54 [Arthrobacter phage Lennox]|uniref:Uncharacterized protein n=1 Tax=Arthrobacter phage Lennox TaxID=2499007 RepID=A0A3S9UEH9_9CAUD|nr:hypothetical protein SEA_LENNOX_54 [Arthrobacter phage Lennox]
MAKLSNTEITKINILVGIGNDRYSFFDGGIKDGEGIWYEALRDETKAERTIASRAIAKLVKDGYVTKDRQDGEDDYWVALTAKGATAALALKGEDYLSTELEAPAKAPKATIENGSGNCKCGCGDIVASMGKSQYRPGHDAKHVSNLSRAFKGANADQQDRIQKIASDSLSQALFLKFMRAVGK